MFGHDIFWKIAAPFITFEVIGVIFEMNESGILIATSQEVNVGGTITGEVIEFIGGFIEDGVPKMGIEFVIAEMVGGGEQGALAGEAVNDFPEFLMKSSGREGAGFGEIDAAADELAGEGAAGLFLEGGEIAQGALDFVEIGLFRLAALRELEALAKVGNTEFLVV